MENATHAGQVLLIPCSGIGKVHGLISREAVYQVTDHLIDLGFAHRGGMQHQGFDQAVQMVMLFQVR